MTAYEELKRYFKVREGLDFSNWICYLHISWTNPQSCWGFFVIFMDQNWHVMENKPHPSSFTSCIALGTSNHKKPLLFYYQRLDTVTLGRGSKIIPLVGTQVSLHSLSVCHCVMVFLCDGRKYEVSLSLLWPECLFALYDGCVLHCSK